MTKPKKQNRTANRKRLMTVHLAWLALVLALPAFVVACSSAMACEDSGYLARSSSAAPESAPVAASTAASATEVTDPCDSPVPEMTAHHDDALKGNCGCAPGDLMCAMKCSAGN